MSQPLPIYDRPRAHTPPVPLAHSSLEGLPGDEREVCHRPGLDRSLDLLAPRRHTGRLEYKRASSEPIVPLRSGSLSLGGDWLGDSQPKVSKASTASVVGDPGTSDASEGRATEPSPHEDVPRPSNGLGNESIACGDSSPLRQAAPISEEEIEELLQNGPLPRDSREPVLRVAAGTKLTVTVVGQSRSGRTQAASKPAGTSEHHPPLHENRKRKREAASSPISSEKAKRKRSKASQAADLKSIRSIERPTFWSANLPLRPRVPLWAAVIQVEVDGVISTSSRPLALISTRPLDLVRSVRDSIVLDISHRCKGNSADDKPTRRAPSVQFRMTNAGPFEDLDVDQFHCAIRWTRDTLAQHVNNVIPTQLGDMLYVLLPMVASRQQSHSEDRFEKILIDWEEIKMLDYGVSRPIPRDNSGLPLFDRLGDHVLFDEVDPLRRLLVERHGYAPRGRGPSPRVRSTSTAVCSSDPCLWSTIAHRSGASHHEGDKQLTLETLNRFGTRLRIMFLSTSVYRSTSLIPAISWAIEDAMLGLELSHQRLDGIISARSTANAITLAGAVPGHVEKSCERLEILGDTVLRLICTIESHCAFPTDTSEKASFAIGQKKLDFLQSNAHLCRLAADASILPYIRRNPVPETLRVRAGCTVLEQKGKRSRREFTLSVKSCGDVVEALIGAAFKEGEGSLRLALRVLEKIGFKLPHFREVAIIAEKAGSLDPDPEQDRDSEINSVSIDSQIAQRSALKGDVTPLSHVEFWLDQLAPLLGHRMTTGRDAYQLFNPAEPQAVFNQSPNLPLGRQVLYIFVLCHLLRRLPSALPSVLSPLVQNLTSPRCLAAFCVTSGLIDTMPPPAAREQPQIERYRLAVHTATSYGQGETSLSRDFWNYIQAPEILCKFVHTIFGDMICDAGYNFEPALRFYHMRLKPFFERYCQRIKKESPPKNDRPEGLLSKSERKGLDVQAQSDPGALQNCPEGALATVVDKQGAKATLATEGPTEQVAHILASEQPSKLQSSSDSWCPSPERVKM